MPAGAVALDHFLVVRAQSILHPAPPAARRLKRGRAVFAITQGFWGEVEGAQGEHMSTRGTAAPSQPSAPSPSLPQPSSQQVPYARAWLAGFLQIERRCFSFMAGYEGASGEGSVSQ